jgi:hypothetical protein
VAHRESAGDCLALNVLPVIRELQAAGATSHNAIAMKLNPGMFRPPARAQVDTRSSRAMIERASN